MKHLESLLTCRGGVRGAWVGSGAATWTSCVGWAWLGLVSAPPQAFLRPCSAPGQGHRSTSPGGADVLVGCGEPSWAAVERVPARKHKLSTLLCEFSLPKDSKPGAAAEASGSNRRGTGQRSSPELRCRKQSTAGREGRGRDLPSSSTPLSLSQICFPYLAICALLG